MIKEINTLSVYDNNVEIYAIITNATNGKTNGANKTAYMSFTFQDRTGCIDAKLWNAKQEQIETFVSGVVVLVKGDVIKYAESIQMKIASIEVYSTSQEEQVKYLKSAPISLEKIEEEIKYYINKIENKDMYQITDLLFNQHVDKFLVYPAASRNHHEYVSGLAHHIVGMLKVAESLIDIYPSLNQSYLYAGIILHDLGKLVELSSPVLPEYTVEGKLLGHISIASAMIKSAAEQLGIDNENSTILMHMVLSHHGKLEFGSPVLPLIREAEVISIIDNLDARINMIDKALENVEEGSFTKRMFPLENRSFYKPK